MIYFITYALSAGKAF